jgi:hypothetical protein
MSAVLRQITPAMPKTKVITLTPKMASELLEGNHSNRPMRHRYVSKLAAAMKRGEWELNGDAIRVSTNGTLLDGQHRCAAVVESGVTVPSIIVTGLSDEVFATIDRGLGRTTSDSLAIRGMANSTVLAAMSRLLHIYMQTGDPFNGNPDVQPTAKQQLELIETYPELHDSARWVQSSKWSRKYMQASLAGFCHFLFHKRDPVAARTFFAGVETGAGLPSGSPVLLLRNRLTDSYSSKDRITPRYRGALTFKAFKFHRLGETTRSLRVRTEGDSIEKDVFVL